MVGGSSWRAVAGAGALIAALCTGSAADAQELESALATELFNVGRALLESGDYAEARLKLAESARLDPTVGTLAKLAECEQRLGKLVAARAHWQQAYNLARSEGDERLELVGEEFAKIDAVVPKLKLSYAGKAGPDLKIRIDTLQTGAGALGVPVPVEPGSHTITVEEPGKKAYATTIELEGNGAVRDLALPALESEPVEPAPAEEPPPPAPAPPPPRSVEPDHPTRSSPSTLQVVGAVTAGVGLVGLGVGTYFGTVAKSKLDLSNRTGCDGNRCTDNAADTRNEARRAGNLSTAFLIGGGVLVAGGVTMWLVAPRERAPGIQASFGAAPGGGSVSVRGAF